jgi:hypothetical protein
MCSPNTTWNAGAAPGRKDIPMSCVPHQKMYGQPTGTSTDLLIPWKTPEFRQDAESRCGYFAGMVNHRRARTMCRASLVFILMLALSASESQAATRRSCQRTCKRFERHCMVTTSKPGRCQRMLRRLANCGQRFADVACEATTTPTSSTTTTTLAGPGAVVAVDEARAATKTFPLEGGTLETTGGDGTVYTLTIPPDALLVETTITMTPIVSISGGDLPGTSVLGVDLKPSGLRLYEFAELSIASPQLSPTANIAGFSYEGDGDDLHRYPAALDAGRILLHVIHFSGAGARICVELCPPPIVPPPPPITESQLEQMIAQLDPHHPFYASRLAELLQAYYDLFIAPDLPLMEQDCEYATSRIPKALAWSRTNQILLAEEGFEDENQTIGNSLVASVSNCWSEAAGTCLDPSNAYQVQNLLEIARQAQLLGGDPEVFDPSKVRRCSGLWSGTITYERRYDEDGDFEEAGAHVTRQTRLLERQTWQISPNLAGDPCDYCQSRMFDTAWTGFASVDNRYVTDYGDCAMTTTQADQIEGATSPSALSIGITRDQQSFYINRPGPGFLGAPPHGVVDKPYDYTFVDSCHDYEETRPFASLHVVESWTPWPFPQGLPLGRTDPTIPTSSEGEHVDRQESTGLGGGLIVSTTTWRWQLTLEPEAAQ